MTYSWFQAPLPAVTNPCTQDVVAAKKIFFPYPNDPSRFMMCEGVMQVNIMTCPSPLVWDQGRESCVYTVLTGSQPSPNVVTTVAPGKRVQWQVTTGNKGINYNVPKQK